MIYWRPLDLAAPHDFFPFDLDMITLVLSSESYFGVKILSLEVQSTWEGVMHQTIWLGMGLGTLRFVGGEGQSLAQGTQGREPQMCFNQSCGV